MGDDRARHVDAGGPFETDEARSRVDLRDEHPGLGGQKIDAADPEPGGPCCRHRQGAGLGFPLPGGHRSTTGRIGSPLAFGGLKTPRRYHLAINDQQPKARTSGVVILLNDDLVPHPPQGVEHGLKMVES